MRSKLRLAAPLRFQQATGGLPRLHRIFKSALTTVSRPSTSRNRVFQGLTPPADLSFSEHECRRREDYFGRRRGSLSTACLRRTAGGCTVDWQRKLESLSGGMSYRRKSLKRDVLTRRPCRYVGVIRPKRWHFAVQPFLLFCQ